ncbi:MAG: cbb3-type cytochrome oxidase subunit 3 [Steroidobacteraceae bacterium]
MNGVWIQVAGIVTVMLMLMFVAIWVWVWHSGHQSKYEQLARLPMADSEEPS